MVSIFSGEVNRTWRFCDGGGQHHEVSLYHHPLTGARAALVDHEELEGSLGTSSVFHNSTTTIPFSAGDARGAIHIQRNAMLGFSYAKRCRKRVIQYSTWVFSKRPPRGKHPRFEFAPRDDRSSKNEPKRVETDRDMRF